MDKGVATIEKDFMTIAQRKNAKRGKACEALPIKSGGGGEKRSQKKSVRGRYEKKGQENCNETAGAERARGKFYESCSLQGALW